LPEWLPKDMLVPLVVLGVACVLCVLLSLLQRRHVRRAARRILTTATDLYSTRHEYRLVDAADYPELDLSFYTDVTRRLIACGFRHMGDLENVTVARSFPRQRALLRSLLSADGTVKALAYDVKTLGWMGLLPRFGVLPRDMRTVDLGTELTDGTFLLTTTAHATLLSEPVPGIRRIVCPRSTSTEDLLRHHHAAVTDALRSCPEVQPCAFGTLDEMLESEHRAQALRNAYRASKGYMDQEELRRIAHGRWGRAVQGIGREIERLKAERADRRQ